MCIAPLALFLQYLTCSCCCSSHPSPLPSHSTLYRLLDVRRSRDIEEGGQRRSLRVLYEKWLAIRHWREQASAQHTLGASEIYVGQPLSLGIEAIPTGDMAMRLYLSARFVSRKATGIMPFALAENATPLCVVACSLSSEDMRRDRRVACCCCVAC